MAYHLAIVSYMDVLGFQRLIESSETHPEKIESIRQILSAAKRKGENQYAVPSPGSYDDSTEPFMKLWYFSDLMVRTTFQQFGEVLQHLHLELPKLAEIQLDLLRLHKILVRGGVCFKPLYRDPEGKLLFGPGLVRSYKLAEEIAVVPRIIIDTELVHSAANSTADWWKQLVRQSEDGQYFVDYLNYEMRCTFTASNGGLDFSLLDTHKRFILEELAKEDAKKDEKVRQKIIWMALDHNRTIQSLIKDYSEQRAQLKAHKIKAEQII